jgi:RHS repeat-associated protein
MVAQKFLRKNYYPFGMMHNSESHSFENPYQYNYNGKELQETGMYDYGARFYMPDVGRWGVVDPLAEVTPHISSYHYANNSPVMYNDPTGMVSQSFMDNVWNSSSGTTWYNTGTGFVSDGGSAMDYDGNNINWGRSYMDMLMMRVGLGSSGEGGGVAGTIRLPELVLNGYGRANHWGGAISTYNINHGILLNGIAGMQSSWNRAVFEASQPFRPVLHNGSAYMMSGDLMGISDLIGIGLSRVSEEHPYAAMALGLAAIITTKGRATDDVLKTETRVFRAVNDVELASINSTGKFFVKNGLTEAKYFAKSLEDAHLFGKQLYPEGYTVVEGIIYNSNNPMKYWSPGTDGIGAFIFNQKILKAIKPIIKQ